MAKKPGIFDPWRQAPKPPPKPASPEQALDAPTPLERVQFDGVGAGLTVAVPVNEQVDAVYVARDVLAELLTRLIKKGAAPVLQKYGVTPGHEGNAPALHLGEGTSAVKVSLPENSTRPEAVAVDSVALALRDIQSSMPHLKEELTLSRVKPFLR